MKPGYLRPTALLLLASNFIPRFSQFANEPETESVVGNLIRCDNLSLEEVGAVSYIPNAQALRDRHTRLPPPKGDQGELNISRSGLDTLHTAAGYLRLPEMDSSRRGEQHLSGRRDMVGCEEMPNCKASQHQSIKDVDDGQSPCILIHAQSKRGLQSDPSQAVADQPPPAMVTGHLDLLDFSKVPVDTSASRSRLLGSA